MGGIRAIVYPLNTHTNVYYTKNTKVRQHEIMQFWQLQSFFVTTCIKNTKNKNKFPKNNRRLKFKLLLNMYFDGDFRDILINCCVYDCGISDDLHFMIRFKLSFAHKKVVEYECN